MEIDGGDFLHGVLDHLLSEESLFLLHVGRDFSHVFQQKRANGFGGMSHVDGPVVTDHLAHEWQSPAMVQVKVGDNHAIDVRRQRFSFGRDVREIGESSLVLKAHVHSAIQHDVLATHGHQNATATDVLARAWRKPMENYELVFITDKDWSSH